MFNKCIRLKDLLSIMAVDIVRDSTNCEGKILSVPLEKQQSVITSLLPTMRSGEVAGEFYSVHTLLHDKELLVKEYNFFVMYVEYEEVSETVEYKSVHIKGFNTYYGLKNFIEKEFYSIDMFRVYVKSFDEYKGVEYKYCVNQESEKITDFSIPSLAEFFPVNFTNGKNGKRITIPYFAGVVPCLSIYKEYVTFVISEYFIEGEPFEVKGHVTYEGKRLSYVVKFDGNSGYGEFSEM